MPTEGRGSPVPTRRRLRALSLLTLALLPSVLLVLTVALPLLSSPSWLVGCVLSLSWIGLPWLVLAYFAYGAMAAVGALRRTREERRRRLAVGSALLGGFVLFLLSIHPAAALRWRLLRRIPARARPLIVALGEFRKDNGRYPASLDRLVPRYLDHVPDAGASFDPEFYYTPAGASGSGGRAGLLADLHAGYDLSVCCPPAYLLSFESRHYWPSQHHPEHIPGGDVVRRIDGWAYVRD